MTSFKTSNPTLCPQCNQKMHSRSKRGSPVWTQILFGVSFGCFLVFFDQIKALPFALWGWCIVQILIGTYLYIARNEAKKRIWHCVYCTADLR